MADGSGIRVYRERPGRKTVAEAIEAPPPAPRISLSKGVGMIFPDWGAPEPRGDRRACQWPGACDEPRMDGRP